MSITRTMRHAARWFALGTVVGIFGIYGCAGGEAKDDNGSSVSEALVTAPITWLQAANVTPTGADIKKTSGANGAENAGAVSQQTIDGGDGSIETTIGQIGTTGSGDYFRWFGLTQGSARIAGNQMDYAFRLQEANAEVYEKGAWRNLTTVAYNDVLKIAVSNGVVRYYKNATLLYTSTKTAAYPLRASVSFITLWGMLNAVKMNTAGVCPPPSTTLANVSAAPAGTGATVTWTTSIASNSQVQYATNSAFTGSSWTALNGAQTTSHSVALSSLASGTTYYYRVYSTDPSGNQIQSAAKTFATASQCSGPWSYGHWPPACWRPYSASSPFNTPLPTVRRADQYIANDQAIWSQYRQRATNKYPGNMSAPPEGTGGWPTYYASASDPVFRIHCDIYSCPSIEGLQIHIPANAVIQAQGTAPNSPPPDPASDRHLTVVDQTTGYEYDLWKVSIPRLPATGGNLTIGCGGKTRIDGLGLNEGGGQGMVGRVGNLAGRIRVEELQAGEIKHALSITLPCSDPGPAVWPTVPNDNGSVKCSVPGVPLGARLVLDMSIAEINALNVLPWQKTVLRAMATYGMFFEDTGTSNYFDIQTESGSMYRYLDTNAPDPWRQFAQANTWDLWNNIYVGKLQGMDSVWQRVRVLKACVSDGTCL